MLLLQLPDEILCHLLRACSQLTDPKGRLGPSAPGRQDILNFGLTCRKAHGLAGPHLLSSCLIRRSKHVSRLTSILNQDGDDSKLAYVRDLALVPSADETSTGYADIANLMPRLPNLEHLFIEIPYHSPSVDVVNKDLFELLHQRLADLDASASAIPGCPVPNWSHRLTTCHLNFQSTYGGVNHLKNLDFVVFAPRLRQLTLVSAHIEGLNIHGVKFSHPQHASPLRSLCLDHCSFSLRGISQLLSIPAALRSFSFYPHATSVDHDSGRANILGLLSHTLSSLATYQRHSLTDLSIRFEGLSELSNYEASVPFSSHISLTRLINLSNLKVTLSEYDRFQADSISVLFPRLPSSITHLWIEDKHRMTDYPQLTGLCRGLLEPLPSPKAPQPGVMIATQVPLPRLISLTIIFTPYYDAIPTPLPPRISPEQASSFSEQGHLFRHRFRPIRSRPLQLTVIRRTEIITAIPPYLWDEDQPEDVLVYNNMNPEDLWATETETEKKKVEQIRIEYAANIRRQEALLAAQQAAAAAAQAQAQTQLQLDPSAATQEAVIPQTEATAVVLDATLAPTATSTAVDQDEGMAAANVAIGAPINAQADTNQADAEVEAQTQVQAAETHLAQAAAFAAQMEGAVTIVSAVEEIGMVQGQTNSA